MVSAGLNFPPGPSDIRPGQAAWPVQHSTVYAGTHVMCHSSNKTNRNKQQCNLTDPMPQQMRKTMSRTKLRRAATGVSRVLSVDKHANTANTHFPPYLSASRPPGICEMRYP